MTRPPSPLSPQPDVVPTPTGPDISPPVQPDVTTPPSGPDITPPRSPEVPPLSPPAELPAQPTDQPEV